MSKENPFEGLPGENLGSFQTGDRRAETPETKTDESYNRAMEKLQARNADGRVQILIDTLNALSEEDRKKIDDALNENGRDWNLLAIVHDENVNEAQRALIEWAKATAGKETNKEANKKLCETLYEL